MAITTVSAKGQVLIPSKIRRKLKINKGTKVYIEEKGNEITRKPAATDAVSGFAGILQPGGELTKALLEEREKDRRGEDAGARKAPRC